MSTTGSEVTAAAKSGPPAIAPGELTGALDRAALRATNPDIDDAAFDAKWSAAIADPFAFFRAFAAAYHADLAALDASRVPGGEALCVGDAHPENFGWMRIGDDDVFAVNDFDDAGYCPVAFDAVRYFVALSLAEDDDGLTQSAIERYVDTVKDGSRAVTIDHGLAPSWSKVRSKGLSNATDGDAFILGDATGLAAVTPEERDTLAAFVAGDARLDGAVVRDAAAFTKTDGGSAGLLRYWLLADPSGDATILELKAVVKPGVEWGRHTRTLSFEQRFATLKKAFWGKSAKKDTFGVDLFGRQFMLRDRLIRQSTKLGDLDDATLAQVVGVEASQLALAHAGALTSIKKDPLRAWLIGTTSTLASRWKTAWQVARGE